MYFRRIFFALSIPFTKSKWNNMLFFSPANRLKAILRFFTNMFALIMFCFPSWIFIKTYHHRVLWLIKVVYPSSEMNVNETCVCENTLTTNIYRQYIQFSRENGKCAENCVWWKINVRIVSFVLFRLTLETTLVQYQNVQISTERICRKFTIFQSLWTKIVNL